MKKLSDKIANAAHIKQQTLGTSNEISFSVLDAARQSLDGDQGSPDPRFPALGIVSLFTLGRAKKPIATPTKERGLHLSSGEFVSAEDGSVIPAVPGATLSGSPDVVTPTAGMALGSASHGAKLGEAPAGSGFGGDAGLGFGSAATAERLSGGLTSRTAKAHSPARTSREVSWKTPEDEVARRKTTRKRRKRVAVACMAAAVVVAFGFAANALVATLQEQQSTRDRLLSAIGSVEGSDDAIVRFDELVVEVISDDGMTLDASELDERYSALADDLDSAYDTLLEAKALIERVEAELGTTQDKDAANQAIASINARVNMVDAGRVVLEETIDARSAMDCATQAWQQMLEADARARDAAALVTNTTVDSVNASIEKSNEAIALFEQAKEGMQAAQAAYAPLDLTSYVTYIDLRIEAQRCAIASDQAYLDRDKETAAEQNERYNELDAHAAEVAQDIATNPAELAKTLLDEAVADERAAYVSERSLAGGADAILRDYLGTKGK